MYTIIDNGLTLKFSMLSRYKHKWKAEQMDFTSLQKRQYFHLGKYITRLSIAVDALLFQTFRLKESAKSYLGKILLLNRILSAKKVFFRHFTCINMITLQLDISC